MNPPEWYGQIMHELGELRGELRQHVEHHPSWSSNPGPRSNGHRIRDKARTPALVVGGGGTVYAVLELARAWLGV